MVTVVGMDIYTESYRPIVICMTVWPNRKWTFSDGGLQIRPISARFTQLSVSRHDGHNFQDLENAFTEILTKKGQLNVIIADTIRGKGLPSIEARADRWFCNFSENEVQQLLEELHGEHATMIDSEVMMVR